MVFYILALSVSVLMLISNCLAFTIIWTSQANLSASPTNDSRDPEIAGYGIVHATVWEEWNGNDWDVYLKYTMTDGITWISPPVQPATTAGVDEINPAVAVTNNHPQNSVEFYVVYQKQVPDTTPPNFFHWEIHGVKTNNLGLTWTSFNHPVSGRISGPAGAGVGNDAIDPAIVYTEDQSFSAVGPSYGYCLQIVWAEQIPWQPAGDYRIGYRAYSWDPNTLSFVWQAAAWYLRINPFGWYFTSAKPEIASVDEFTTTTDYVYPFYIVFEDQAWIGGAKAPVVWYVDGFFRARTSTGAPFVPVFGTPLPIPGPSPGYDPDIAATQDFRTPETYYIHIAYEYPDTTNSLTKIQSNFYCGGTRLPGAPAFGIVPIPLVDSYALQTNRARPTVTVRLINFNPGGIYESWVAYEKWPVTNPADIYYRMGIFDTNTGFFTWTTTPAVVGYTPLTGSEENPELWTRNAFNGPIGSAARIHLAFDDTTPTNPLAEITYIDP